MTSLNSQLLEATFTFARNLKDQVTKALEDYPVSMLQLQVLFFLKKSPRAHMNEIASFFKIELPSATSLVNKLAILKLVTRQPDKKDRRVIHITLTKLGENLLDEGMKARKKYMEISLSKLSQKEKQNFLEILQKLIQHMESTNEK